MPIGFSDGNVYEDELHVIGNLPNERPKITITREQHPFDKALNHLNERTDDPISTFLNNELGRTQAPMPRPDPRGSRPTYEEGDTIPGSDSYGSQSLGGREYKAPDMVNPDQEAPSITPRYNPETTPLNPPDFKRVADSDLSSPPAQPVKQRSAWDKLTGQDGGERYQLWPEKAVREVLDNVRTFATTEPGSEANIQAAARMAFDLGLGGLAGAQKNAAGVFGGMLGGARKDPAIKEMLPRLEKALPEEEVTRLTGWWKGPDKKWRFEIPDKEAKLDKDMLKDLVKYADTNEMKASVIDLDAVLKHDKLYEVYPELQGYKLYYSKDKALDEKYAALFMEKEKSILVGDAFMKYSNEEKVKTLLHEIQHSVQAIEGFARGGSPESSKYWRKANELEPLVNQAKDKFTKERAASGVVTVDDLKTVKEINDAAREIAKLRERARQEYLNLAGEKEARSVEERYSKAISPVNPSNIIPKK